MGLKLKTTNLANLCPSEPNPFFQSTVEQPRILLIDDVSRITRDAKITIYRDVAEVRSGKSNKIPLPISQPGEKLKWLAADFEQFLQSRSPPPDAQPQRPVAPPAKPSKKQAAKSFTDRQEAARQALKRHGIDN